MIAHEHRGEPDALVVCHLPYGPTAFFGIYNTVLRHDIGDKAQIGTVSEAYPHLIFDNFTSKLGERVSGILKHLFPPPKAESKRVMTFANQVGLQERSIEEQYHYWLFFFGERKNTSYSLNTFFSDKCRRTLYHLDIIHMKCPREASLLN